MVDPDGPRITGIHVGGGKRHGRLVDWDDVASFGSDAVMVESAAAVHDARSPLEARALKGELSMLDKRVLDSRGDDLGALVDVEFDPADGTITALALDRATIEGDRLRGVGRYAVVVDASA